MPALPDEPPVAHYNLQGHAHELTFSTHRHLPLLNNPRTATCFVQALDQARLRFRFSRLCFVVMPEHVHLIVYPRLFPYSISDFLKSLKQPVAQREKGWLRRHDSEGLRHLTVTRPNGKSEFSFWLDGPGYDRNVTKGSTLLTMVRYIHNNPVRRALVHNPLDWHWSSARWYQDPSSGPLRMDPLPT